MPSSSRTTSARESLSKYRVLLILKFLSGYLQLTGERAVRTYFNVYLDMDFSASPTFIGICWAVGHCLSIGTALLAPFLCHQWGLVNVSTIGAFGMITSLLIMAWIPHPYVAGLAFIGIITFAASKTEIISPANCFKKSVFWSPVALA